MKAVARLLLTYFAGSSASKWLTISGLLMMLASLYVVFYLPQTEHMLALAWPGIMTFFLGTFLMPLTVGRMAQSHAARILPGVRVKLLISAILTVLLVALPVALLAPLAHVAGMSAEVRDIFSNPRLFQSSMGLALLAYTSACIAVAWIYVLMWFVISERNAAGFAKAMVVVLVLLLLPANPDFGIERIKSNLLQIAVFALVFGAGFLAWPRLRRWYAGWRRSPATANNDSLREFAGREVDLMLGNTRPWRLVVILVVPMAIAMRTGGGSPAFWLFYLTVVSIIGGGNTEKAPSRSRALWLRGDWSRASLFNAVEKSAWRHNGFVMVILLLFLLGIGRYTSMSPSQLITGIPLIVLGTALSTYLGLSITRGVRTSEALIGAAVMSALVVIAVMAANSKVASWIIITSLAILVAVAIALREVARRRWAQLDWSLCRREIQPALRAG